MFSSFIYITSTIIIIIALTLPPPCHHYYILLPLSPLVVIVTLLIFCQFFIPVIITIVIIIIIIILITFLLIMSLHPTNVSTLIPITPNPHHCLYFHYSCQSHYYLCLPSHTSWLSSWLLLLLSLLQPSSLHTHHTTLNTTAITFYKDNFIIYA